jgi:hypothetical protein
MESNMTFSSERIGGKDYQWVLDNGVMSEESRHLRKRVLLQVKPFGIPDEDLEKMI